MHIPVLQKEVLEYLEPKSNENFIDCTVGEGGHSLAILERNSPEGKVLGIELDEQLYKKLLASKIDRLIPVNDSYANLKDVAEKKKFRNISGILFDLGFSGWHLEESDRGFSFQKNEFLDMRYDLRNPLTAEKILNFYSVSEIKKILKEYGEERFSEKIARAIIESRKVKPVETTLQLVKIIEKAVLGRYRRQKIHFATRTFQALRIAVNDELNNLKRGLPQAVDILNSGGKIAVISFHSLEDRIVKNFFKKEKSLEILTKKPVGPRREEIKINPRSRSAKLRVCQKL